MLTFFKMTFVLCRLMFLNFCVLNFSEESEVASKQVLAKAEEIRKFQEENKYLGKLVSSVNMDITEMKQRTLTICESCRHGRSFPQYYSQIA